MDARENAYVLWFDELRRADVGLVGGKSSSLGELTSSVDVPVPYGLSLIHILRFRCFGFSAMSEMTALTGSVPAFSLMRPFFSSKRRALPPLEGSLGIAIEAPSGRSLTDLYLLEKRRSGAR